MKRKVDIPNSWRTTRLSDLLLRKRLPVAVEPQALYREIGVRSHGKGIFHKEERTGASIGRKRVFWVEPKCFVVNIVFAWEGAIAKTKSSESEMIASHRFPMYKPHKDLLDLDYLVYFFKSHSGIHLLGLASPGGAGRNKTLGQQAFLNLSIPLPPIEEQRKIAEILGAWDEAIWLTEELIAAKQQRKKALMQQLLTGKRRIPEFVDIPWHEVQLEDVALIIMGQSPSSMNYNQNSIGLPLIQGNADIVNRRTDPRSYTSQITKRCQVEDIILSVRAPVGEVALSLHEACIGRGVCAIRPTNVDKEFLYQLLISIEKKWYRYAQGSTFTAINSSDIKRFKLSIPRFIDEQQKIGLVLRTCDEDITLLIQKVEGLKLQKKGLMQQMLTGNLRVSF